MTTASKKHQTVKDKTVQGVDGYGGKSFLAFSQGETVPFTISLKLQDPSPLLNPDPENPTVFMDCSGLQIFVSMTDASSLDCSTPLPPEEFAEAQIFYTGQNPTDSGEYWFSGEITDEQTILLPAGKSSVVGAIKIIDNDGRSTFADKALITVSPCRNKRLDRS